VIYTVTMEFQGKITKDMDGIYPCFYRHDGKDKMLIATQFESHYAREAFPNIDEPEAKATFDLTLTTPAEEVVVANTPAKSTTTEESCTVTSFETTPRMSSYLLAFVYGEMDYLEGEAAGGVIVRTYATPGKVAQSEHALDSAIRSLEFFNDYFDTPYPLQKLDLVALPDFSVGAMENWGLITFREQTMLADPKSASIESKQLISLVVSHEMSHQWFGNLVTMKWWDDLWLNESFANMMEYRAVDAFYPEWNIWEQFVSHEEASAKRRDSLVDVQSVQTPVNHPDEINTVFDPSIVYAKGGSLLYMLMNAVGEKAFRAGLKAYFKKHAYSNTTADDLWVALSQSSGWDVGSFMHDWLSRPGYPIVSIDYKPGSPEAEVSQKRFLADPAGNTTEASAPWHVPLATTIPSRPTIFKTAQARLDLESAGNDPVLFNHEGHSYFVPYYANQDHVAVILKTLAAGRVSPIDRLLLLDNYTMLQRGGYSSTTELLDILPAYKDEKNENVWGAMTMPLGEVRKLVEGNEAVESKLDKLIANLVTNLAVETGWEDSKDDSAQRLRLRGLAHSLATSGKVKPIIEEGLRRFHIFEKPADLPASTRSVIYYIGARFGSQADFDRLLKLHDELSSADEKEEIAGALTGAKDAPRYTKLIDKLTDGSIRRQDLLHWYVWLLRNRYSRQATWQWMKDNWDWIVKEMGADKTFNYYARYAGSIFSRQTEYDDYRAFFDDKKSIVALERDIVLAEQEMQSRIAWRERNEQAVIDWLKKYSV
jgi:aminopeptidase N